MAHVRLAGAGGPVLEVRTRICSPLIDSWIDCLHSYRPGFDRPIKMYIYGYSRACASPDKKGWFWSF